MMTAAPSISRVGSGRSHAAGRIAFCARRKAIRRGRCVSSRRFPPGGTSDTSARLLGQWLSDRLGQPFIVENRPGAATNIGTEVVVRAAADGYTLLGMTANNATNATIYGNLSFNFIRDIAPVARTILVPLVLEVHPIGPGPGRSRNSSLTRRPIRARSTWRRPASARPPTWRASCFGMMAGVKFTHVPYRGDAPAVTDLIGGQVQVYFGFLPASIEHIRTGKLRALAVTTATRLEVLPEVPTVGEFVPGYEATSWNGIGAPAATPTAIIDKLHNELNAGLADPRIKERFTSLGAIVDACSVSEFANSSWTRPKSGPR